ncbi:MAG: cysteine--tRNA ligase [Nitriliruptorales bacterium]|nr:cysteine--tRNA ligase [Nitriliruptorales bacterium]
MRLYNTLTRTVEEFTTRDEGRVGIYVCGPTVQNVPHFGHARAAVVPDVLRRWLRYRGYQVFYVRNITDVEDKIIARAEQEGRPPAAVAEAYTRIYEEQMAQLNVMPPDVAPRATGHIIEMIGLIERLVEVGVAYEAGGDVFFSVRKFDPYGSLSGRNVDDLRSGARIEPTERKRDPLDFALWKAAKPGEPSWTSPWGRGRPGWHIECSAMAAKYLGVAFDVHAGGLDLIFPHHENEIAQSEAASGRRFARFWVHNGMVTLDDEKMSKSVGNVIGLGEALDRFGANILRLFLLSAHYRSPVDFSEARLEEARAGFDRWRAFVRATRSLPPPEGDPETVAEQRRRFEEAMDDDLGTPAAQAALFDLVADGNRALERGDEAAAAAARRVLVDLCGVLGYAFEDERQGSTLVAPLVEELLRLRMQARERRDFETADDIRSRLGDIGVIVEDSSQGPRWHIAAGREHGPQAAKR